MEVLKYPIHTPAPAFFATLLLSLMLVCTSASAVEKSYFGEPSLEGFSLINEDDGDGDGDGIKETHIKRYRNKAGNSIFNMNTNGHIWAWSFDTHADDDSEITNNYVIRDSDCDGVFDERYSLSEEFHVPECVK